jgi:hypothetical protein
VRSVAVTQFGTTVGQSLGDHLVVGSTLKLVRAGALSTVSSASVPLDVADDLKANRQSHVDLDVGAMASLGHWRLGIAARNLRKPSFGDDVSEQLTLRRQVRAGVAVSSAPKGLRQGVTVAADADLTATATVFGDVRHVAAGVEGWFSRGRVGLRAGTAANTIGERRVSGSAGISVALARALHVNASRTVGRDDSLTGWSSSVSVAF